MKVTTVNNGIMAARCICACFRMVVLSILKIEKPAIKTCVPKGN